MLGREATEDGPCATRMEYRLLTPPGQALAVQASGVSVLPFLTAFQINLKIFKHKVVIFDFPQILLILKITVCEVRRENVENSLL